MSLTKFALRYRSVTYVLLAALMVLGVVAIGALSRREDPELTSRYVQVIALYPGASAAQVEMLLTDKLERSLLEVEDMKNVTSTSRDGIAEIQIEAADRVRDIDQFRHEIRDRVADIRSALPQGVLSVDINDRYADTAAVILGITRDGATDREREVIARQVRDRLRQISDITQIDLIAEQKEQIHVSLSSQRLSRLSLTASQVGEAIARRNVLPSSGGALTLGAARFAIQPTGNVAGLPDLENLIVASPDGSPIYLRDVADVIRSYADPASYQLRVNGKPAVGIAITMRKGRNITDLGTKIAADLAELKRELPAGTEVTYLSNLPRSVERRIGEFAENLISGVILILIVLYLFMGIRSAAIVGAMLPVTIVGTFALMYLFRTDIQQMSITALIIALGLVVDNSIVVVDNIEHKLSRGVPREQAVVEGTDELRVPLLTSNLTTVASFLPIVLLSGGVGEFIRDLGIVTTLATVVSLLLNYTITPLLALQFLKSASEDRPGPVRRRFVQAVDLLRMAVGKTAAAGLKRARLTVAIAIAALAVACAIIPKLGSQFFPGAERDQFTIDVWLPEGRDIEATSKAAARIEAMLAKRKEVASYAVYIGQTGPRFYYNIMSESPTQNYAQIVVNTRRMDQTHTLVPDLQREVNAAITEARVTVKTLEQGPPIGAPIAVRLNGNNLADLRRSGELIKAALNATPGATSVYSNYGELPLALDLKVNEEQAAAVGLSSTEIAQATTFGTTGQTVSNLREGDKEIPIVIRLDRDERGSTQALQDVQIPTRTGTVVPLRQVARFGLQPEEGRIVRRNHQRTLTVYAYASGSRLASAILSDAQKRIAGLSLPPSVHVAYGGEEEETNRTFTEMLLVLGLTVVANLIIVVWEFNSLRAGLTILAAVPLSMTGAVFGLFIAHQPFGFMAFQGIIGLSGIITNHAIVLFEYAGEEQRKGFSADQALMEAGRKRLRPILLTVCLSIFGVLPQAVNGGTLWPPFAWSLICGLLMSLLLTLVVVPAIYKVLPGKRERLDIVAEASA